MLSQRAGVRVRSRWLILSVVVLAVAVNACGAKLAVSSATPTAGPAALASAGPCPSFLASQSYLVQQLSMEPALEPGDRVIVAPGDVSAGDIIVFQPPAAYSDLAGGQTVPFIKRVIGVGGDEVEVRDGSVYVNGVQLPEPYVFDGQPTQQLGAQTRWVVPNGYLYVLGDHREQSQDSRVLGPIPADSVLGRVVYRCFPGR